MTRTLLALLVVGLVLAMPGFAAITIDFGTGSAGVGGIFDLNGTNATGTNIPIGDVTVNGAPANNGVFDVTGTCHTSSGCLNFDTTAHTISIIGAIPALGIASQTLLSGTLTSFTADGNGLHNATGSDTKSADLLAAIGASNATFHFFGFSLATSPILTNPGSGSVISSDIRNDEVPEPASIALFGTVLLGSCIALRRRRTAAR